MQKNNNFVHLHVHDHYSLLDGYGSPIKHARRAKELGMKALASTNHNHLAGIPDFVDACNEVGIKPILGLEMYYTHDMNTITLEKKDRDELAMKAAIKDGVEIPTGKKVKKKDIAELIKPYSYDTRNYHILFLAKNQVGWVNLMKIQSIAAEKGLFNGRYNCDLNLLKQYSEGLIVTTACIGSLIARSLREDMYAKDVAVRHIEELISIFGKDNVCCEIQGLDWDIQYKVNKELIALSKEYDLKLIATNDVHYTNKKDNIEHDILLCIGTGKKVTDVERMRYEHEFWIKSYEEMIESFKRQAIKNQDEEYMIEVEQAIKNTNIVADMIEDDIKLGSEKELLPIADIPEGYTPETYIREYCYKHLYKYLSANQLLDKRQIYEDRLKTELDIIVPKGFASYLLITHADIEWADNNGVPVGPGRGN